MRKKIKKAEIYREELRSGMTCKDIAQKHGISVQAVYAACGKVSRSRFHTYEREDCVWAGLRNWLNDNKVSRRELLHRMGLEYGSTNLVCLNDNLSGKKDMRFSFMRKMTAITGLTLDELFGEEL